MTRRTETLGVLRWLQVAADIGWGLSAAAGLVGGVGALSRHAYGAASAHAAGIAAVLVLAAVSRLVLRLLDARAAQAVAARDMAELAYVRFEARPFGGVSDATATPH